MSKYLAVYGRPRYLGIVEYDGEIIKGDTIVVESHRGEEYAVVAGTLNEEQEAEYRRMRSASEHGDGSSKTTEPVVTDLSFVDFASREDIEADADYRAEENVILKSAKELLKPHNLDMKLIDVEFLRNKRKLFFYFSSDQRVDFRAYVRDLAREFKTRIELRQIGVRDEAKVIRGVGPCGQPCCCSYWLNQFAPICIKMVKEQNLALNPAKISGICGRLMCCMCFEHNVYHEVWSKLPNPGTKIKTPNGNVIISGIELQSNSVRCFIPGHGEIKVPVDKFDEFKNTVMSGENWITEEEEKGVHISPVSSLGDYADVIDGVQIRDGGEHQDSRKRGEKRRPAPKPEQKKSAEGSERQDRQERQPRPAEGEKTDKPEKSEHRRKRRPRKPNAESRQPGDQRAVQAQEQISEESEQAEGEEQRKPRRVRRRKPHGPGKNNDKPTQPQE